MTIQISEVWNAEGKSVKLAKVESVGASPYLAREAVEQWIKDNRPDLTEAWSTRMHGFHAVQIG
jgi:hypothetical protein